MQQPEASVTSRRNAAAIARGTVFFAAASAIGATWVLGVGDKETCSNAFGVRQMDGRTLTICNWVGWFLAIEILATLIALLVSLRDIQRHESLRRIPLYTLLFAAALACYIVPSVSFGFR